jgi:hypothetical protein
MGVGGITSNRCQIIEQFREVLRMMILTLPKAIKHTYSVIHHPLTAPDQNISPDNASLPPRDTLISTNIP